MIKCKILSRAIAVLLVAASLLTLSGCGKSEIEKARDVAVDICEQFMDNKITAAEAKERLNGMYIPESEDPKYSIYLKADIAYLSFVLGKGDYDTFADRVESLKNRRYE